MTEAEWLACDDFWALLEYVDERLLSERKSRLLAVACCRRIWHIIPVEEARACVETAEQFADGIASRGDLDAQIESAMRHCRAARRRRKRSGQPWEEKEEAAIRAVNRV